MAQEVIFAEQTLNGFALKADFGLYAYDIAPAPFSLVLGESYIVVWDGETFTCEAQDMSAIIEGDLALGNLASVGGAGNNEPFIIGWTQYGVTIFAIDNESAHSMAIYQDAGESYAPNDAVILSYSKSPVHYENVPKVWLTHPSSTEEAPVLVPFTYGEAVGKTVEPDFSEGDMAVEIADGELVKELTIAKPADLVPEKIAEGEYIAGVGPGTHVGGGGGSSGSDDWNIVFKIFSHDGTQGTGNMTIISSDELEQKGIVLPGGGATANELKTIIFLTRLATASSTSGTSKRLNFAYAQNWQLSNKGSVPYYNGIYDYQTSSTAVSTVESYMTTTLWSISMGLQPIFLSSSLGLATVISSYASHITNGTYLAVVLQHKTARVCDELT